MRLDGMHSEEGQNVLHLQDKCSCRNSKDVTKFRPAKLVSDPAGPALALLTVLGFWGTEALTEMGMGGPSGLAGARSPCLGGCHVR